MELGLVAFQPTAAVDDNHRRPRPFRHGLGHEHVGGHLSFTVDGVHDVTLHRDLQATAGRFGRDPRDGQATGLQVLADGRRRRLVHRGHFWWRGHHRTRDSQQQQHGSQVIRHAATNHRLSPMRSGSDPSRTREPSASRCRGLVSSRLSPDDVLLRPRTQLAMSDETTRRDFLQAGVAAGVALGLAEELLGAQQDN
ncbi:MAG TPA: hypothetical protein DCE47_15245, partial [Planctomycetaceae bacterium]|nr:hypothetical protein [Planctomycetaceae bacterium]